MATTQTPKSSEAKAPKVKKDPIPAFVRISKKMKGEALRGKVTVEELDKLAKLAEGLKAFISA